MSSDEHMPLDKVPSLLKAWPIDVKNFEIDPDFSHICQVTASTGERYILKNVGELSDTISPLEQQHRITQYLHRSGVRLGYLLTTKDGGFYATDEVDAFILMPYLEREKTNLFTDTAAPIYYNIGRAYAHLHTVLATYKEDINSWKTNLYSRLFEFSVPRMLKRHGDEKLDQLKTILSGLENPIADISPHIGEQPVLWDCHTGNTLIYNGQVSGFVDCDHISIGPRICDIGNFAANLIAFDCSSSRTDPWLKHLPSLLQGYASGTVLTDKEQIAFPLAIPFFLLVLLDHFQEHGPKKNATKVFDSAWWVYNNLHRIQAALLTAFPKNIESEKK